MRHLALLLLAALLAACTSTGAEGTVDPTSPPSTTAISQPSTSTADAEPSESAANESPATAEQPPSTEITATPSTTSPEQLATEPPADDIDQPQPILVTPAAAPDSVLVTVDGDPGPITIWVDSSTTSVDVTFDAVSSPDPTRRWRIRLVGGGPGSLQRPAGNPVEATFTLSIAPTQEFVTYTVRARAFFEGWGQDTIEVTLSRLSS